MRVDEHLPRLLVIDDVLGRQTTSGINLEREEFCAALALKDVTGDGQRAADCKQNPIAEVVFCRGQRPARAARGDVVENDLATVVSIIEAGWRSRAPGCRPWSMLLLDLCFFQGEVQETGAGIHKAEGVPAGRPGDDEPASCFGFVVLEEIARRFSELPVVVASTLAEDREVIERYGKHAARGFLEKLSASRLSDSKKLAELLQRHGLLADAERKVVGSSIGLLLALRQARQVAPGESNVLLTGETGSGKGMVAEYIHLHSPRRARDLKVVNLQDIPDTLVSSELFGSVRGAFNDAQNRLGIIRSAARSSLFLDEIGGLPPQVQGALLRAVQKKKVRPVGGDIEVEVDVRFISATSRDAKMEPDLRARFGLTIRLPSLRERPEDIRELAEHYFRWSINEIGANRLSAIADDAHALLASYDWPLNVNELAAVMAQAVKAAQDVPLLTPAFIEPLLSKPTKPQPTDDAARPAASREGKPEAVTGGHPSVPLTTSNDLAVVLAEALLEGQNGRSNIDLVESKKVFKSRLASLLQLGLIQPPHGDFGAFFDGTWQLVAVALERRNCRWTSGGGKRRALFKGKPQEDKLTEGALKLVKRYGRG